MREMKRAQELRVDEFSVQKLRESHETTQKLTSRLQELQEQLEFCERFMGDFQEVESNHSGRLFYVSSQPVVIPSSRSLLSRDKRLPFDTWNTSWTTGKHFLVINLPRLTHPEIITKEFIISLHQVLQDLFYTLVARDEDQNRSTIPMPTFARRPSGHEFIISGGNSTEFHGWDSEGQQIPAELHFHKFPTSFTFLYWKIRFKDQLTTCSFYHRKLCYGSTKWRWSIHWKN